MYIKWARFLTAILAVLVLTLTVLANGQLITNGTFTGAVVDGIPEGWKAAGMDSDDRVYCTSVGVCQFRMTWHSAPAWVKQKVKTGFTSGDLLQLTLRYSTKYMQPGSDIELRGHGDSGTVSLLHLPVPEGVKCSQCLIADTVVVPPHVSRLTVIVHGDTFTRFAIYEISLATVPAVAQSELPQ